MNILRLANTTVPALNQFSNSVAENTFSDSYQTITNNYSGTYVGNTFTIKGFGYISSMASSPGTLIFKIKWGSVVLGTATITLPVSLSNSGFMIDAIIIVCLTGTSGRVSCQGMTLVDNNGSAISAAFVSTGLTTTGQKVVNTQSASVIGISSTFSVANAGNIVTLSQLIIEEKQ